MIKKSQLGLLIKEIVKQAKLFEVLSPKSIATIDKWRKELGDRKAGVKLIDVVLQRRVGLSSADLADTSIFANGLDAIEEELKSGNYEAAIQQAIETAKEMMEDEGGEGIWGEENIPIKEDLDDDITSHEGTALYLQLLDIANLPDPSYRLILGVKKAILKRITDPKELRAFVEIFNKEFGSSHMGRMSAWDYFTDEGLQEVLCENVHEWVNRLTFDDYKRLKKAYLEAIKNGQTQFKFNGYPLLVEYAKLALQYLEFKFGKIKEDLTHRRNRHKPAYYGVEYGIRYCHFDPKKEKCPVDMKVFSYIAKHIPTGKVFPRRICCYNIGDFHKLLSHWTTNTWQYKPAK